MKSGILASPLENFFKRRGIRPFPFQREAWRSFAEKKDLLVHYPTGMGKTYAATLGLISKLHLEPPPGGGPSLLYISPMKALITDIGKNLEELISECELNIRLGIRSGDTSSYQRAKQKKNWPELLLTTPESLAILLTSDVFRDGLSHLQLIVVDEWHELMGQKRGVHLQLLLSQVFALHPQIQLIALSATLNNISEAAENLQFSFRKQSIEFISSEAFTPPLITTILPNPLSDMPWSGHLGAPLVKPLAESLDFSISTIIFCNTRFQAERWHQLLCEIFVDKQHLLGTHHSSLDREERLAVEDGIRSGALKVVVSTSSLDLGVDFPEVERVYQVGSPKGVSRFLQRAGRSRHRPGERSEIFFVPTNAFQLFELAAIRLALEKRSFEGRPPISECYDLLAQHILSRTLKNPASWNELFHEVRATAAYREMSEKDFDEVIEFLQNGGEVLERYPLYQRLRKTDEGYLFEDSKQTRQHLLNVGTITARASMTLKFYRGGTLGQVEENSLSKLKKGEKFIFGGRTLSLERISGQTAYVKLAKSKKAKPFSWTGGNLPISSLLAEEMKEVFLKVTQGDLFCPELDAASVIISAQLQRSAFPLKNKILIEFFRSREGDHLFVYPMAGRICHDLFASVLALRLSRLEDSSFAITTNDYGIELLTYHNYQPFQNMTTELFSPKNLEEDFREGLNFSELGQRAFRDIAQISGLTPKVSTRANKTVRNLQLSSSLLYEVFKKYSPNHFLYRQAHREVSYSLFDSERLRGVLEEIIRGPIEVHKCERPSPLAFPIMMDRLASMLSTENLKDRVERLKERWFS